MDIKSLSEHIGIDVETCQMILDVFFKRTIEDLCTIETAVHECNAEQANKGAHSIKGSAGNLALDDIYELAREIEEKARGGLLEEIPPLVPLLREKVNLAKETLQ